MKVQMMKRKVSVLSALMVGMSLAAASAMPAPSALAVAAESNVKIAVVDMQKALQSVESGKKAKAQLEKEFNARKKELQNEESSIKKMGNEFKKQAAVMNEDARAKKQNELQQRIMQFQEKTARSQAELQQKEHDLTAPIIDKLRTVVTEVAKQQGYTVVLEKNENTVLYSQPQDDLTNQVISAYNKKGGKG